MALLASTVIRGSESRATQDYIFMSHDPGSRMTTPPSCIMETEARSRKPRLTAVGIRCGDHATPSIRKSCTNFADKRRSLGRYNSLAD
jgi:hypothetical protein